MLEGSTEFWSTDLALFSLVNDVISELITECDEDEVTNTDKRTNFNYG